LYGRQLGGKHGDLPLVRYPYIAKDYINAMEITELLRRKGCRIGDWYRPVIYPASTNIASMKYVLGSCPVAEDISKRIINLPTGLSVTREDVEKVCNIILSVESRK